MTALDMTIGGRSTQAADGRTFEVVEPAHGQAIAVIPSGSAEDVDRAVAAAQAAFEGEWRTLAGSAARPTPAAPRDAHP